MTADWNRKQGQEEKKDNEDKASRFEALRARLVALAYRMLGSRAEAEDVVQDAWLKWHAADATALHTPAAWLTTVTTRLAIDRLRHLQRERTTRTEGWVPEPWRDELAPSAEDLAMRASDISYGVMLLLERLKPEERAAFLLHEAFDCDYAEIAQILDRPAATCRQIAHRAKERLQRAGAPLKPADPAAHARIVERLRAAIDAQDRAGLMALFGEGVAANDETDMVEAVSAVSDVRLEPVSIDGTAALARLEHGEITALFDVQMDAMDATSGAILSVTPIADPLRLRVMEELNRAMGARAVRLLLRGIFARALQPMRSTTVCGDFPVDIDA